MIGKRNMFQIRGTTTNNLSCPNFLTNLTYACSDFFLANKNRHFSVLPTYFSFLPWSRNGIITWLYPFSVRALFLFCEHFYYLIVALLCLAFHYLVLFYQLLLPPFIIYENFINSTEPCLLPQNRIIVFSIAVDSLRIWTRLADFT